MRNKNFSSAKFGSFSGPLGRGPECSSSAPSADAVAQDTASVAAFDVWVHDPASFIAGKPQRHFDVWYFLSQHHPQREFKILEWICKGISVKRFITPFKGQYQRVTFNNIFLPDRYYPNNKNMQVPYRCCLSRNLN